MRYDYLVPFIDREKELAVLEREWRRGGFSLITVYGRRRVGKTRLLKEFLSRHGGAYYVASELTYPQIAREFLRTIAKSFGFVPRSEDVVDILEEVSAEVGKALVILDEFQYVVEAEPSIPSRLQRSIDEVLSKGDVKLVISGSAVSFFERELLGYKAPLFGRRTATIRLRPMRFLDAAGFFASMTYEDAVRTYAMLGGTPAYARYAYGASSWEDVLKAVVEPGSPLLDEAEALLRQELREPRRYMALLKAMAEGRVSPYEAANVAGVDPRSVHRYVDVLEELDIITLRKPLGFRRGARIFFRDNYFRFWFACLQPLRNLIEVGSPSEAIESLSKCVDRLLGKVFEGIAEESLPELIKVGAVTTKPVMVGPWWHKGEEVDLVVRDPGNSASFIEVKWGVTSRKEAEALLRRLKDKARLTGLQERVNEFILILGKANWLKNTVTEVEGLGKVINYEAIYTLSRTTAIGKPLRGESARGNLQRQQAWNGDQ